MRLNEFRSAQSTAAQAPGSKRGPCHAALEDVFKPTMPREMGFELFGHVFSGAEAPRGSTRFSGFFGLCFYSTVFLYSAAVCTKLVPSVQRTLITPVAIFEPLESVGCAACCSSFSCHLIGSNRSDL